MTGRRGHLGADLDLGEPQWAVCFGDEEAHWYAVQTDNAHRVVTTCGRAIIKPLLYHPGSFPLCRHCASRHRAPSRCFLSNSVIDWLNRPPAPTYADKRRPHTLRQ
ncbi:hypothetical protein [Sphingobium sp. B11D3A]|uniref:hypothetical protein n=1 Tax=Sphingobium sp. B11D3A TaxID=2940574 RepID=UPI0022259BB4|nr:hypothetical protein [Sphingobium sp. B11D3A]MCW2390956.1 hypothetical protein [Sphingobium sp. B11D3A]